MDAYYFDRMHNILNQIGKFPIDKIKSQWNDFLTEMCGDDQESKDELVKVALLDEKIIDVAKHWLKKST